MFYSFRWRTVAVFLLLLAASLAAAAMVLRGEARRDAQRGLEQRLGAEARALAQAGGDVLAGTSSQGQLAAVAQAVLSRGTWALVVRADGSALFATAPASGTQAPPLGGPDLTSALAGQPSQAVRANPQTGKPALSLALPVVRDGRVIGAVRVAGDRSIVSDAGDRVVRRVAIVGGIALFAGLIVLLWLTAPLKRVLDSLTAVARRLAGGNLYERAALPPFKEAQDLSIAVNDMAAGFERQVTASYQERDTVGALIDAMADALLVVEEAGTVSRINPAAMRLFAPAGPSVIGQRLIEVVRDHEIAHLVSAAVQARRQQTGQVEYGREQRLLRVSVTPLQERGRVSALVLIQDLTEIQRLQGMRREFVANVSHELRTPLASVKSATEALQSGALEEPEMARDFLARIQIEVDHMTEMVQRLLDLSQVETGKARFEMQRLDLKKLLMEAIERVRPQVEQQGLALQTNLPDGLPAVTADRTVVHQVLLNLIDNSLKFTREGHIRVTARASDGMAEVVVEDTGTGIPPEHLPHIFERFYKADRSRSSGGTGLGLALAKHNVQAHGGRIWAESRPGQGTAIHFTLPLAG